MTKARWFKLLVIFFVVSSFMAVGCKPKPVTPTAPKDASEWTEKMFSRGTQYVPFFFNYKETPQSANYNFGTWTQAVTSQKLDDNRTKWVRTFTDPKTGLQVRCEAIQYLDYPAVEWVVYLTNTGTVPSWNISNLYPANFEFETTEATNCGIYYSYGIMDVVPEKTEHNSPAKTPMEEFKLVKDQISLGKTISLSSIKGRSSCGYLPYFNIQRPDSKGSIMAIGWSGDWAAKMMMSGNGIHIRTEVPGANFQLMPGETVRTPSFLRMFYDDTDSMRGHNKFRKLILDHFTPKVNGKLPEPITAASAHGSFGFMETSESDMINMINNISAASVPVNTFWIDAGWYDYVNEFKNDLNFLVMKGDWASDPTRYPNGLKPVADAAHGKGLKFSLWFEPERVSVYANLLTQHPDWVMSAVGVDPYLNKVLNLGDESALNWTIATFGGLIDSYGVDIYRQDMNAHCISMSWQQDDVAKSTPKDFWNYAENSAYVSQDMGSWDSEGSKVVNLAMDFNGDGKDELVRISREGGKAVARVYRATASGFETTPLTTTTVCDWAPNGAPAVFAPIDANGDGKVDLFVKERTADGKTLAQVLISNGTAFSSRTLKVDIGDWMIENHMVQDFPCDINGDGRDELLRVISYENGKMGVATLLTKPNGDFTGQGAPKTYTVGDYSSNGEPKIVLIQDAGTYTANGAANGDPDGRADLVLISKNAHGNAEVEVYYSNGTTFTMPRHTPVDIGGWDVAGVLTRTLGLKIDGNGTYDIVRLWKDTKGLAESDILYADGLAFGRNPRDKMTDIGLWDSEYLPIDINGDGKQEILVMSKDANGRAFTEVLSYAHIQAPAYNRYGIAELKHVAGLYSYWDKLRETRPNLLIDNCASGGGRLDFEAIRRSVALWRSDNGDWNPEANQNETLGLGYWMPLTGRGSVNMDPYMMRSGFGWCTAYAFNFMDSITASSSAKAIGDLKDLQILASGDYYPLIVPADVTSGSAALAWQYDRPDLKKSMIQIFRRKDCKQTSFKMTPVGINGDFWSFAKYRITIYSDSNKPDVKTISGYNLVKSGLTVNVASAPGSAIVVIEKI